MITVSIAELNKNTIDFPSPDVGFGGDTQRWLHTCCFIRT